MARDELEMGKGGLIMRQELTAAVRAIQDEALSAREQSRASLSARVLALRTARLAAERRRRLIKRSSALAVLAFAASLLFFIRPRTIAEISAPLSFTVDRHAGAAGMMVQSEAARVELRFSDGSELSVSPASVMRVASVGSSGAEVVLERGVVHTRVVPRAGNRWSIAGGPYRVHVKGTRFDTSWDPTTEVLRVSMEEGHVLVTGPCLGEGRHLVAGDTTEISCNRATTNAPAMPSTLPAPSAAAPSPIAHVAARSEPQLPSTTRRASPPAGPDDVLAHGSADDLMRTADEARRNGQPGVAMRAYRVVRARFPGGEQAARATFVLARLLADAHDLPEAERLLLEYTSASPSGTFSEEAWGRLLEIARARGDADRARVRARVYIERFPGGASIDVARATLDQ